MFARLWLALFVVAGVLLGCRRPEMARRLGRMIPLILLTFLGCLLITGAHQLGEQRSESHRWLGHAMVITGWIGAWFSLGVLLARERLVRAIGKCALVFTTFEARERALGSP